MAIRLTRASSQYLVRVPADGAVIDYRQPYAFVATIRVVSDANDYGNIFSVGDLANGSLDYLELDEDGTTLHSGSYTSWTLSTVGSITLTPGVWYNVALVRYGAADCRMFCDAVQIGSAHTNNQSGGNPTTFMGIGSWNAAFDFADIRIANAKIFDRSLTVAEIAAEHAKMQPASSTNLWGWYPAVSNSLAAARLDYSGNGRHWTAGGTPTIEDGPPIGWGGSIIVPQYAAAGGDASAALGGSAASATAGSATAALSVAPLGAAVTASAGTLSPQASYSAAITGERVAESAGTLTPGASAALTGGAATASAGTAAPQTSVAVTGVSATVAAGTLTASAVSSVSVALTGDSATASAGSLAVDPSVAAQGSEATVSAGTVTASSVQVVALSGASVTASAGSLAADLMVAAQGSSVTAAIGTLTLVGGTSVAGSQVPAGRSTGGKRRRVIVRDRVYMVSERDIPALLEAELLDRAPPKTAEVVEGPKPRKRVKKAAQPVKTVEQVQEAVEQIKASIEPENAWLMQALEAVAYRVLERLQDEEESIMLLVA